MRKIFIYKTNLYYINLYCNMPRNNKKKNSQPYRNTVFFQNPLKGSYVDSQKKKSLFENFGNTMVQGAAFGAGSSFAHSAIDSIFHKDGKTMSNNNMNSNSNSDLNSNQMKENRCEHEKNNFINCIYKKEYMLPCQVHYDLLKECEKFS